MVRKIQLEGVDFSGDGAEDVVEYEFEQGLSNVDGATSFPQTVIEAGQPINNQVLKVTPPRRTHQMQFIVFDEGVDRSNGTFGTSGISDTRISGGTVVSVEEQIVFLEQYVMNPSLSPQWRLFGGRFDGDGGSGTPVSVKDFTVVRRSDDPEFAECTLRVEVGQIV